MKIILRFFTLTTALIAHSSAMAALEVRFIESAPKDSFVITYNGETTLKDITLTLDLTSSAGNLIFDTTASGAGVEVFQPFELKKGNVNLSKAQHQSGVVDGEQTLILDISKLTPEDSISFTIDVDDQLTQSALGQIRVTSGEMSGAIVSITNQGETTSSAFNDNNIALIDLN